MPQGSEYPPDQPSKKFTTFSRSQKELPHLAAEPPAPVHPDIVLDKLRPGQVCQGTVAYQYNVQYGDTQYCHELGVSALLHGFEDSRQIGAACTVQKMKQGEFEDCNFPDVGPVVVFIPPFETCAGLVSLPPSDVCAFDCAGPCASCAGHRAGGSCREGHWQSPCKVVSGCHGHVQDAARGQCHVRRFSLQISFI